MKKRIIAAAMTAAALTSVFTFSAFASTDGGLRHDTLFEENFDSDAMVVGENPTANLAIKKANDFWVDTLATHPWTTDFQIVSANGKDGTKGLELSTTNAAYRIRTDFTLGDTNLSNTTGQYKVNEGALAIEFDAYQGLGGLIVALGDSNTNAFFRRTVLATPLEGNADRQMVAYKSFIDTYDPNKEATVTNSSYGMTAYTTDGEKAITLPVPTNASAYSPWLHYKIVADVHNHSLTIEVTDESGKVTTSAAMTDVPWLDVDYHVNDDKKWYDINSVVFAAGRLRGADSADMPTVIDNIEIYTLKPRFTSVEFTDFKGNTMTEYEDVYSAVESIALKFDRKMDLDSVKNNAILLNNKTNQTEALDSFAASADGKTIYAKPAKGYLDPDGSYTITVGENAKCAAVAPATAAPMSKSYSYSFTTGKGGFQVIDLKLFKGENEIESVGDAAPGDTVTLKANIINTDTSVSSRKISFVVTAVDGMRLKDIQRKIINCTTFGNIPVSENFVIDSNITFDRLDAFVWNLETSIPVMDNLFFGS